MTRFTAKEKRLIRAVALSDLRPPRGPEGFPIARSEDAAGTCSDTLAVGSKDGVKLVGLSPELAPEGARATGGKPVLVFTQLDIEELIQRDFEDAVQRNIIVNKFTQDCLKCAVSNTAHLSQFETKS